MGEKIRVIGSALSVFDIELNKAPQIGGERLIHIQNKKGRLCISESVFIQMATAINYAEQELKKSKKLEVE